MKLGSLRGKGSSHNVDRRAGADVARARRPLRVRPGRTRSVLIPGRGKAEGRVQTHRDAETSRQGVCTPKPGPYLRVVVPEGG